MVVSFLRYRSIIFQHEWNWVSEFDYIQIFYCKVKRQKPYSRI